MAVRNILLDTNAYTAFKRGALAALEIMKHAPLISINSVILGELLGGFAVGSREAMNKQELKRFLSSNRVKVFLVDDDTAEYYALVYQLLRRKGQPIPTNDIWIAATALQHNLAVFTYDSHFQAVDGIIVGNHLADFMF